MRCYCGAPKTAPIHSRHTEGGHGFGDPRPTGLQPISEGRREYQASQTHKEAYGAVAGSACVFEAVGAPDPCHGPLTPHHTFAVGRAGNRQRAERVAPVVPACAFHNTWVSQDAEGIAFGETHWITVGGRDWPLLMRDADARDLEADGREFKPASPLLSIEGEQTADSRNGLGVAE
jgi:hypothetical protein